MGRRGSPTRACSCAPSARSRSASPLRPPASRPFPKALATATPPRPVGARARYGRVLLNEAAAPTVTVISVNSQSTIAVTTATESAVEARSSVVLQGVSLAGGALRIESLQLARATRADGTEQGSTTSSEV